ncbi:hypothetical protein B0T26DRAFT_658911 [Lasiosphaeria miniovina]|uniref:DUF1275 domain protein n=1 Tax=Lasiosphaeria miniovina TaxID=1954250 RepID=A0AA40DKB0_9PEZI|nr:uncharacterized protein B0T26DRAFT_658911 [Lasiosphaeria miniovina]KAK0702978.1 hypothetical protein B0T26DRAFT_658911 [Lasiosphaeria miniovina]
MATQPAVEALALDSTSSSSNRDIATPNSQHHTAAHRDAAAIPGHDASDARHWLSLARLRDDISLSYADLPVLACCMVSGLCDSVAFNATGTFASMQTGNTIFLALGASGLPANAPLLWLRALVSIVAFWAGCLIFSKSRHLHPQRKATLSISFLVQAAFVFAAAALSQTRAVPAFGRALLETTLDDAQEAARNVDEDNPLALLPLALLAFQFGGQIVVSRLLGFNEVPTNVLTSLYCDLLSDPLLLARLDKNPKRNRRLAAIVLLVAGGVVGGWLQRSRAGMSSALWLAGSIKFVIAIAWIGWRSKAVPVSVSQEKEKQIVGGQV